MRNTIWRDNYGMLKFGWVLLITLVAIGAITVVLTFSIRAVSIHYDRAGCHTYAKETGREARFVFYTYWQWDCLVHSSDGKWISKNQLREFPNR